jgi:hypothetical protein
VSKMRLARGWNQAPYLPPGVTLRQIDGGPTYYADNGFTLAANVDATMTAAGAKSWDDPSWFPVGSFWAFYWGNSLTLWNQLNLKFTNVCGPGLNLATTLHANGIWNIDNQANTNWGNETIGLHIEEPPGWASGTGNPPVVTAVQGSPFPLTGRFLQPDFTQGQLAYEHLSDTADMQYCFTTPISTTWGTFYCNLPGADNYLFCISNYATSQGPEGTVEMGVAGATADQMARGSNYGDQVDLMREWNPNNPVFIYIENDDALCGPAGANIGGVPITPPQANWAFWSSIVHGVRIICWFATASDDGNTSTYGFSPSVASGQVISMLQQGEWTNALCQNLAYIINSPFAVNYVTASPAAYNFGQTPIVSHAHGRNGWGVTGIDVMTKYYTGGTFTNSSGTFGNGFYIFATYRGSETATNISVAFTTADSYAGPVTAINADGGGTTYGTRYTLTASGGEFSDTLAAGSSVRIYYIPR